jgi:hypothetical protein
LKYGYTFKVLNGYKFNRGDIFSKYVSTLYNLRLTYTKDNPMNLIAKLLMNSLYGKFGMKTDITEVIVINKTDTQALEVYLKYKLIKDLIETKNILKSELLTYSLSTIILNTIDISRYKCTILMLKNMDQELVEDLKLNFNTILTNDDKKINSNVAIASAVTSYARIIMIPFILNKL